MIALLKSFLFGKKPDNSLKYLVLKALGNHVNHHQVKVENLYTFVYEPMLYQRIVKELSNYKNLDQIKSLTTQDLTVDCVQLFLVYDQNSSYIVSIFDPYDYHQQEYVMDVIELNM